VLSAAAKYNGRSSSASVILAALGTEADLDALA